MIRIAGLVLVALALTDISPLFAQTALDRLEDRLEVVPSNNARPQLGLMADERDLRRGVLVFRVLPDSPAERAGFRTGDQIIEIGGQIIRANVDIASALAGKKNGDQFESTVMRGDRALVLSIFLGQPREARKAAADELPPPRPIARTPEPASLREAPTLGVTLTPMTASDLKRYPNKQGAVIRSIIIGSLADKHKLPLGALIVGVDGQRITSPDDVATAIEGVAPQQEVEFTLYNQGVLSRRKVVFNEAAAKPVLILEESKRPPIEPGRSALDQLEERLESPATNVEPKLPTPDPQKGLTPADPLVRVEPTEDDWKQKVFELEARIRRLETELQQLKQPTPAGASE